MALRFEVEEPSTNPSKKYNELNYGQLTYSGTLASLRGLEAQTKLDNPKDMSVILMEMRKAAYDLR